MSSYREILKRYWGYDDFRGIQRDIIESIGQGHDTLGLMPTGGGKSVTFQVPALAMEGVCLVITPLIALMKDQVHHLRRHGILAAAIYTGMQRDEVIRILENCILGRTKFLYVSPERLSSDLFVTKLRHMRVSFITVDEAHCISQWGYDFRPSYLEIARIRQVLPEAPVLALTATATPQVVDDICEKLTLDAPTLNASPLNTPAGGTANSQAPARHRFRVCRMSFERKNLAYKVHTVEDKDQELVHLLTITAGAAIVYVRSRRRSREVAERLSAAGLSATFYHAGLDHEVKDQRQRDWQGDRVRIIVCTNAFGMGIDKPDVRLVVHYDCPDSIEAYFQEAGRAGRDGRPAEAVMLYNQHDQAKLRRRIDETFPSPDEIRLVYDHLAYFFQIAVGDGFGVTREFLIDEFCRRFHHFPVRVHSALQILARAGYIDYDENPDSQARIRFRLERHELYRLNNVAPDEERVITTLLRNYGGLFVDFGYVDEPYIARLCGMETVGLQEVLRGLASRHIVDYIPRQHIPTIQYLQRREDGARIQLPAAVYQDRKQRYEERILAIINYVQNHDRCRSRQLLAYFGEMDAADCGRCDICCDGVSTADLQAGRQAVANLLRDGRRHHVTELLQLRLPTETIDAALASLVRDDVVMQQDGYLFLA